MNKKITSKEAILSAGKEIIIESGVNSVNIRDVARICGISVGSVYNYFPSKNDLVVATIESVWTEIMMDSPGDISQLSFYDNVSSLYKNIQRGCQKYPSFFSVHSMSAAGFDKSKGREAMNRYLGHIKNGLLESLNKDKNIKDRVFTEEFTKADFVDFIFSNITTILMNRANSCDLLLEVVKRIIY